MTMTAYHGITLAVIAVVALGTAMYTYFSTRNRPQGYQNGRRRSIESPPLDIPPETVSSEDTRRRKPANQDTCTICFDLLKRRTVISLPCGHMFHSHCIRMWLHNSKSCPVCRSTA